MVITQKKDGVCVCKRTIRYAAAAFHEFDVAHGSIFIQNMEKIMTTIVSMFL